MKGVKNMKKQYVKPELYFEDFELSANIAAGCIKATNYAAYVCTYETGGEKVFSGGEDSECTVTPENGAPSLCYDNPTADTKLFSS